MHNQDDLSEISPEAQDQEQKIWQVRAIEHSINLDLIDLTDLVIAVVEHALNFVAALIDDRGLNI